MPYWTDLVRGLTQDCAFAESASEDVLAEIEQALGIAMPGDLLALWRESNGIRDKFADGIWSVEVTIRENLDMRSYPEQNDLHMSFDPLLFFGCAGNGDLFFYPIQAGGIHRDDIFRWNHETDSRVWIAGRLESFVTQWYGSGSPG